MKSIALVIFSIFVSNAHAAWTETKCSNSDGSVKWESGVEEEFIHLKYANFVEGTLTLEIEKVNIEFTRQITLKERTFKDCRYKGRGRVFAGKVKIIGSEKHPDVLRGQFPENKVQTEVICTTIESAPSEC
jgi:hypothetical protein